MPESIIHYRIGGQKDYGVFPQWLEAPLAAEFVRAGIDEAIIRCKAVERNAPRPEGVGYLLDYSGRGISVPFVVLWSKERRRFAIVEGTEDGARRVAKCLAKIWLAAQNDEGRGLHKP